MEPTRRQLALNASVLLEALVARDEGLLATYLDLTDGGLLRLFDPAVTGRANEAVLTKLDAEPDRYSEVPRYTRHYRLMADFVDTVEDDDLARLLDTALSGREAFRRFEAVLGAWPDEQVRWGDYRQQAMVHWAVAWLRSVGVEPEWDLPLPPETPSDVPELLQVALLGAAGPRDGERVIDAGDDNAAARLFLRVARQLCELRCEPFRARTIRGRSRFSRGGLEVRREGSLVMLSTLS